MEQRILTADDGRQVVARRIRSEDGPGLQAFNRGLGQWARDHFLPHAYDDATVARYIQRALAGVDRTYVALADGAVVGYFFLWDFEQPVPVLGIGIADDYQDQGLGEQMMQMLIEDAREAGRDGIELTTCLDNERAYALFTKMGFEYVRNVDNVAGDGRVVTEREMFLPLKAGARVRRKRYGPPE